jgi:integrase
MMSRQARLTETIIDRAPFSSNGPVKLRDTVVRGLHVVVGRRTKTFAAMTTVDSGDGRRRAVKKTLGHFGPMSLEEARQEAARWLDEVRRGAVKKEPLTLRSAWERFRADLELRGRSPLTISMYERTFQAHVPDDIMGAHLRDLAARPDQVAQLFDRVSVKENGRGGPVIANRLAQAIRAVYRFAYRRRLDPALPPQPPTDAIDLHRERRRSTALTPKTAPAFWKALQEVTPVRREFQRLMLFSGARPSSLKVLRWSDVDVEERWMRFETVKGDRAYSVPLSKPMIESLGRVREAGMWAFPEHAGEWVFPSAGGHVVQHRETRLPADAGSLRQTYRSAATAAGVPELIVRLLMGHSLRGVSEGYITVEAIAETLRESQEAVSVEILGWVGS